ncbi:hypothetical protein Tco_1109583 [Tanacetum coccineum]
MTKNMNVHPIGDSSNTKPPPQWGKSGSLIIYLASSGNGCSGKLMMRVGPLVPFWMETSWARSDDKKMNVHPDYQEEYKEMNLHPEWSILQTQTNVAKRNWRSSLFQLVKWAALTNGGKKDAGSSPPFIRRDDNKINVHPEVVDLQTLTKVQKGSWIHLHLHLKDTKKMNVHPEWLILQTLTNGAKRKLDHLLLHLVNELLWKTNDESATPRSQSGWKTSWAKKDDKEDECASRVVDSSNTNQWGKKEAGSSPHSSGKWAALDITPLSSVKWSAIENNDEVGPLILIPDRKLLAKKDDKEDQCASRVVDSSNTNQWGKKEAGSSPLSSGKWAAMEN